MRAQMSKISGHGLITKALLQYKIYSVVRRHRYQIRAQQAQGSEKKKKKDSTRATFERLKPSIHSALLIAHIPFAFNLLFATLGS